MSDDEERSWEDHKKQMMEFVNGGSPPPEIPTKMLDNALYTMNELGLWPDDVTVSEEQAIMVWRVVHRIAVTGSFPDELRM